MPMLTMMALMIVDCCMLCTAAHCCLQWLHSRLAATARQWCCSQCAGQRLMATSSLCCLLGPGLLTSPAFCVIYTADIACGSVYVTVQCLSVCLVCLSSICCPLHAMVVDLLLWAWRAGDVDDSNGRRVPQQHSVQQHSSSSCCQLT